jgi:hypothetical protein
MSIVTFTLKSASTQAAAPFSFGHAFRKGDVPSGSQLVGDISDLQVVPKNVWADGSLKFAIISGRAALTAATPLTVTLSIGTPAGGADLDIDDLKATGVVAAVDAGAFGAVSWATTDWDTPWQSWVSGPKMSSWVYRKAVGADAHLVAFIEVRLFSGGEVEILPWLENGYVTVASPTNKSATYTFTLGGTARYTGAIDLKHHTRTPLINGTALSYWLGTAPGVTPRLDVAYLQETELVPSYSASRSATGLTTLPTTYAPFQVGGFIYDSDAMTSSGYQKPIGMMPEHDVAYLVCTDQPELLYAAVVRNGYSVGRYPIHYRDHTTNRPVRFSQHLTRVLSSGSGMSSTGSSSTSTSTPAPTGGYNASWDTAHSPALFLAYLITGHWYHMESAQFACTANWLNIDDINYHTGTRGRLLPLAGAVQTRAAAWGARSLVHALLSTPDADTALRDEFTDLAELLIDHHHAVYVAQANNQFGWVDPGEYYSLAGAQGGSAWQQDFYTAAYGYMNTVELPISSTHATKLDAFFHWKAKSIVFRLGLATGYWWVNSSAAYIVAFSPSFTPNYQNGTGPWYATDKLLYDATFASPPAWMSSTEGVLGEEYTSDVWARSLIGNMHPAIAYAVRHDVEGAADAYARLIGATNYSAITTGFAAAPVWSVEPFIPEPAPPMTMRKTVRCDTVSLIPGTVVCGDRGHGLLAADIATGFENASFLEDDIDVGDPANTEYRVLILTGPSEGTLVVDEDGSAIFTPPDEEWEGTATGTHRVFKNGVAVGDYTYSFTLGVVTINLVASNLTGGSSITSAAVTVTAGTVNLVASNLSGGATISAGAVTVIPPVAGTIYLSGSDLNGGSSITGGDITIEAPAPDARYARPDADISAGSWLPSSGSDLFAMVDELTADSDDYIFTNVPGPCELQLSPVVDPGTSSGQVVRYQIWRNDGGGMVVRLKQGATVIAEWAHGSVPSTPTIYAQALTAGQCDSIIASGGAFTDLRLVFEAV